MIIFGAQPFKGLYRGSSFQIDSHMAVMMVVCADVKHPVIDWLAKSDPSKHHALCVHGAVTEKTATQLDSAVVVPPEEQKWQQVSLILYAAHFVILISGEAEITP
jgi:hypothetical protein